MPALLLPNLNCSVILIIMLTPVDADAEFYTDSDIKTLTREDLNELLPGTRNLRLRKDIFETIHKQVNEHTGTN